MHVSTRTPQEVRLLEGVARRVETYDAHQPFYDGSEGKKTASRGTEAVLNALILSSADAERGRREPSEPTRKALRRLWETQRPDGAWEWLDFGLEPFESADAAYMAPRSLPWRSAPLLPPPRPKQPTRRWASRSCAVT